MIGEVRKQSFNLTEDSLFRHCLVDGEILREILEELWQWSIEKLVEVHHDYNIEPSVDHRMITCDIYARDDRGDIYILEMQNQSKKNLRKRSKCYQSISMFDKCTIKEVKKEKRRYDSVV